MKKIQVLVIILSIITCFNCAFGKEFKSADVKAISAAIKTQSAKGAKPKVSINDIIGDFASASVELTGEGSASAYLKRNNDRWKVIAIGTSIGADDLEGEVPNEIIDKFFKRKSTVKKADNAPANRSEVDVIQPFGSFTWHDGIYDVIKKLNAIDSINNVKIYARAFGYNYKYANNPTIDDLITNINESEKSYRVGESYNNSIVDDVIIGRYVKDDFRVQASPVLINGVEYTIVINLRYNLGYAINHSDGVLTSQRNIKYPLLIESVTLYIIDTKTDINRHRNTDIALYDKYKKFNPKTDAEYRSKFKNTKIPLTSMNTLKFIKDGYLAGYLEGSVFDKLQSCFSASVDNSLGSFKYISFAYHDAYQKIYDDQIRNIESNKHRGKIDMKNAL